MLPVLPRGMNSHSRDNTRVQQPFVLREPSLTEELLPRLKLYQAGSIHNLSMFYPIASPASTKIGQKVCFSIRLLFF